MSLGWLTYSCAYNFSGWFSAKSFLFVVSYANTQGFQKASDFSQQIKRLTLRNVTLTLFCGLWIYFCSIGYNNPVFLCLVDTFRYDLQGSSFWASKKMLKVSEMCCFSSLFFWLLTIIKSPLKVRKITLEQCSPMLFCWLLTCIYRLFYVRVLFQAFVSMSKYILLNFKSFWFSSLYNL